jgi:iron complex transport system substrate-binding protein
MRRLASILLVVLGTISCGAPAEPRAAARPRRIVTLAPNVTEIVFALGSGSMIVGTDDFSNTPPAAARLPKVGRMQPDLEKIAALRPDLVAGITAGTHPNLGPALEALHIPLELVRSDRLADVFDAMEALGTRLGSPDKAVALGRLRDSLEHARRKRSRSPRVLFAVWTEPLYVAGRETLIDDLLQLTGATNVIAAKGWTQTSLEMVVANPPDVILYVDHSVSRAQVDALLARGVHGEAIAVDEDLFTRAGPRAGLAAAKMNAIFDEWERAHRDHAAVGPGR